MKKLISTILLVTACTFGAAAQSVVVKSSDGTSTKFAAERVKEITFTKTDTPDPGVKVFTAVEAKAYSSGTVEATFSSPEFSETVTFWIVGVGSEAPFLHAGSYDVKAYQSGATMYIDNDKYYTYVTENGTNTALQSGTMNVAISDNTYTITFDVTTVNNTTLKGQYVGSMPGNTGRDIALNTCETPQVKTNDLSAPVDGEYYIKMNDSSWSYEMAVDFCAAAGTTALPAGTYTYSADKTAGTFSSLSYLDLYSPSSSNKFAEGSTVEVSYEGDNIVMVFNLVTTSGRKVTMTYNGPITFPKVEIPATVFTSVTARAYSSGAVETTFSSTEFAKTATFWIVGKSQEPYLHEGTYDVTAYASGAEMYVDNDKYYTYVTEDGVNTALQSGTMTVAIADDGTYTIDFDVTLVDNTTLKGQYVGAMPGNTGRDMTITMETPTLGSVTDQVAGEYYLKFNDASWTYEGAIDFFADATSTRLPAGTYTFSTEKTPGTFSRVGYLSFYSPSSTGYYAEGSTIKVSYDASDNLVLDADFILESGRKVYLDYTGAHPFPAETPTPTPAEAYSLSDARAYSSGNVELTLANSDESKKVTLTIVNQSGEPYLHEGTFDVKAWESGATFYVSNDPYDSYVYEGSTKLSLTSGTVTVALADDNTYTVDFNLVLSDESTIAGQYVGAMTGNVARDLNKTISSLTLGTVSDQVAGEYYLKMYDESWSYEGAIDFYADATSTRLPAGTYTFSTEKTPGTFSRKGYIDFYSPSSTGYYAEGSTITISYDASDNIVIDADLVLENGRKVYIDYTGAHPFPAATPAAETFSLSDARAYSSGNVELTLANSDESKKVTLTIVNQSGEPYLHEGTFDVKAWESGATFYVSNDPYDSYVYEGSTKLSLTSGTVTVALADDNTYTVDFNLVLSDESTIAGQYVGAMTGNVARDLNKTISSLTLGTVSDQVAGEYYLKMYDESWSYEGAIDFYADATSTRLPAGTYTFSTEKTPGTFSRKGYIDFYSPSSTGYYAEGSTITISYDASDNIVIDADLVLENGRKVYIDYTGAHPFDSVE